jgi:glutaredoxin 3
MAMPRRVQVFTTSYCPYCVRAKALLVRRGIPFEETDVTNDAHTRARLVQLTGGRRTVPQIFIGGVPIGGCDELRELDRREQLLPMVGAAA